MLGAVPPRRQRQGDGETRARKAQHNADGERAAIGVHAQHITAEQTYDHDDLADRAGLLRSDAIDEQPVDETQDCARERRHRDHQSFLCRRQAHFLGNDRRERPEHHPHHEGEVEIEERGEQCRLVPCLPESRSCRSFAPGALITSTPASITAACAIVPVPFYEKRKKAAASARENARARRRLCLNVWIAEDCFVATSRRALRS